MPKNTDLKRAASRPSARPPRRRAKIRLRRVEAELHSLTAILNLVRGEASRSRQELERLSGLGRAIVADRLSTLAELGLVRDGELGPASGGRAPRLVRFGADAGVLLVAVLDLSMIGVGVSDLSGKLLIEHHEAADLAAGPAPTFKRLGTLFDWVLDQHRKEREVWGIGIAVPGPVEVPVRERFGSPLLHFHPSWDEFPLAERLSLRYRAPVLLRSSVQMRTLGESRGGTGTDSETLLFVDLGKDISAGMIADGAIYRGAQGAAGMIGHVATGDDSRVICRCGNTGCLVAVAGADAIIGEALRAASDGRSRHLAQVLAADGEMTVADVGIAAQRGDTFSAELLSRCGRQIGTVLAALTNALNPSLIVLGGELAETGDILLAAIREAIYRRSHPLATRDLRVVRSQMRNSAGLVGSALTLIDEFFSPEFLGGWIANGAPLRHPEVEAVLSHAEKTAKSIGEGPSPPAEDVLKSRATG
jgi:predicted NBD/HSP70 family sugar kinase